MEEFIRVEVNGSPLADLLGDDAMQALAVESEDALAEFVVPSGEIIMPMDAHIVTASNGRSVCSGQPNALATGSTAPLDGPATPTFAGSTPDR